MLLRLLPKYKKPRHRVSIFSTVAEQTLISPSSSSSSSSFAHLQLKSEIKTHGSESRGQEEAGLHNEPVSYLQVALL